MERDLKRLVESSWDQIWSSGITNPIIVIDILTTLLLAKSEGLETWDNLVGAVEADDSIALADTISAIRGRHGIESGSEIEAAQFWNTTRALRSVVQDFAIVLSGKDDIVGDMFEHILSKLSTAGHFGQFRTPNHIVRFIVKLVRPAGDESVLDPACGTAGFLVQARRYSATATHASADTIGIETDRTISRLAQANCELHNVGNYQVINGDGLDMRRRLTVDVVLANPPFAGTVERSLGRLIGIDTAKSELLFTRSIMARLKAGGRAGVVVPNGVLAGNTSAAKILRQLLLEQVSLDAVIELPKGTFMPYTDVKTGILIWRNVPPSRDHAVRMIRIENDGYSLDAKRRPIEGSQLSAVVAYINGNGEFPDAERVPLERIRHGNGMLLPSRYLPLKEVAPKSGSTSTATELLSQLHDMATLISSEIDDIKEML